MAGTDMGDKCAIINTGRVGRETELRACLWLAKQGYEVFDNVFPNGPIDLVAMDLASGDVFPIEVKTSSINSNGIPSRPKLTERQAKLGVWLLIYTTDTDDLALIAPNDAGIAKARSRGASHIKSAANEARDRRRRAESTAEREALAVARCLMMQDAR